MKYKNSQEILEEQLVHRRERRNYINKIVNTQNLQKNSNSKVNNKYLKKEIKEYEQKIKELENTIQSYDIILQELATFPADLFANFLTKVISIKESKDFVYTDVVFTQSFNVFDSYYIVGARVTPNYLIFESDYQKTIEKIKDSFIMCHLVNSYLEALQNSEYLIFESGKAQSLLNGKKLSGKYSTYQYLEEIAYNLIDRRLLEPEKDLQEILNDELEEIKEKGPKKIRKYN